MHHGATDLDSLEGARARTVQRAAARRRAVGRRRLAGGESRQRGRGGARRTQQDRQRIAAGLRGRPRARRHLQQLHRGRLARRARRRGRHAARARAARAAHRRPRYRQRRPCGDRRGGCQRSGLRQRDPRVLDLQGHGPRSGLGPRRRLLPVGEAGPPRRDRQPHARAEAPPATGPSSSPPARTSRAW